MAFKRTLTPEQISAQKGVFGFKIAADAFAIRITDDVAKAIRQALKESVVLKEHTTGIGLPLLTVGQRTHLNSESVDEPSTLLVSVPDFPFKDDLAYSAHARRIIAKQLNDHGYKVT